MADNEDCGQDGVCKLSPGCDRHWEERNRELVRERDEAWSFLRRTANAGGSIVSSAAMTAQQIAIARAADRMLVTPDGYGFVYVPGPRFCACGRIESDCDQSRAACPKTDHVREDDAQAERPRLQGCAPRVQRHRVRALLLQRIQNMMRMLGVTKVIVEQQSGVPKAHINNEVGTIYHVAAGSRPPTVVAPQSVHPEYFQQLDRLYQRAFQEIGISELASDIIIAGRQVPFVQVGMIVHPDDCLNCERDGNPLWCSALVCDIYDDDETERFGMMASLLFRNGERREEPCNELRRRWRMARDFDQSRVYTGRWGAIPRGSVWPVAEVNEDA